MLRLLGTAAILSAAALALPGSSGAAEVRPELVLGPGDTFSTVYDSSRPYTDRLIIDGPVELGGATLAIAVSGPPVLGGASVLVFEKHSAGPVSGAFAGLPEGGSVAVGGIRLRVTYRGGDGNDVVLIRTAAPTTVRVTSQHPIVLPGETTSFHASVEAVPPSFVMPMLSGTMTFSDGDTVLGTALVFMGTAQIWASLPAGDRTIVATYSGEGDWAPGSGSMVQHVTSTPPLSRVPTGPPSGGPPVAAPPPPAAPPVAPIVADPPSATVSSADVRIGLREMTGIAIRPSRAVFSQRFAAPGRADWQLDARRTPTATPRTLAIAERMVTAPGRVATTLRFSRAASGYLRRHPGARLVLRTRLRATDGQVVSVVRRLGRDAS